MFLTGQAFSFGPFVSKEKALSAENYLDLEERTTDGRPHGFNCSLNIHL
jgi:hypothetical protein